MEFRNPFTVPTAAILVGIPVGFVVTAILVANNLRDMGADRELKIKTFAMVLGYTGTKIEYLMLVIMALLLVPVMAAVAALPMTACLSLGAIPVAIGPVRDLLRGKLDNQVVERTAKFHLAFGVLLTVGLAL